MKTLATLIVLLLTTTSAPAQNVFVVNSPADPGDGTCDAAGTGDGCTLREAITAANAASGADSIHFDVPGEGVHTIQPLTALPGVVGPVTLDGYTQPGASPNTLTLGNDAVLRIELDGSMTGSRALFFSGTGVVLRGLAINRATGYGIETAAGSSEHVITGNHIGTDPTGALDLGNGSGIYVFRTHYARIGGAAPADRNVISGNNSFGIHLYEANFTIIHGNYIGTNAAGDAALGNGSLGVRFAGANANRLGGAEPGAGNVISGNGVSGVELYGYYNNVIQGNLIGTNATGTAAIPNANGIRAGGNPGVFNLLIGGTAPGAGNVISGNTTTGIHWGDPHLGTMTIQGNLIGVGIDGTTPLGNGGSGIHIGFYTGGNFGGGPTVVGGMEPGAGNVIAYNGLDGVRVICCGGRPSTFSQNAIFANGGMGLEVAGLGSTYYGPTPNDPGDPDEGINRYQNYPSLTSAAITAEGDLVLLYAIDTDTTHANYDDGEGDVGLLVELFRADADGQEGALVLGRDRYTAADWSAGGSEPGVKEVNLGSAAALGVTEGDSLVATATDEDGNTSEFSPAFPLGTTVAEEDAEAPVAFALHAPYPNPSAAHTTAGFELPEPAQVKLALYDVLGREVAVLVDEARPAGRHEATLNAADLPSGVYFFRLTAGALAATRSVVVLR